MESNDYKNQPEETDSVKENERMGRNLRGTEISNIIHSKEVESIRERKCQHFQNKDREPLVKNGNYLMLGDNRCL